MQLRIGGQHRRSFGGKFAIDDLAKSIADSSETAATAAKDTQGFAESWDMAKNKIMVALAPLGQGLTAAIDGMAGPMAGRLREQAELAEGGYSDLDIEKYRAGALTPVIFGSALKDFGVVDLIDAIAAMAPSPRPQPATGRRGQAADGHRAPPRERDGGPSHLGRRVRDHRRSDLRRDAPIRPRPDPGAALSAGP